MKEVAELNCIFRGGQAKKKSINEEDSGEKRPEAL